MKTKKLLGFTLIELLIVIAIIGILAVAFLPTLLGAPAKARDTQRVSTTQKVGAFLASKMLTGTALPASACIDSAKVTDGIGKLINDNIADFGGVFPADPKADNVAAGTDPICAIAGKYGYLKFTAGKTSYSAAVYAVMEDKNNANILCSNIKADANPTIVAGSTLISATTATCYIVPVQ